VEKILDTYLRHSRERPWGSEGGGHALSITRTMLALYALARSGLAWRAAMASAGALMMLGTLNDVVIARR